MGTFHGNVPSPAGNRGATTPPGAESLFGRLDRLLGAHYVAFVAALAVVLALLLALAAGVDGAPHPFATVWGIGLDPAILVYILAVHPFMHRRWQRAMRSLRSLAPPLAEVSSPAAGRRRGEWIAAALGALAGLAVARRGPGAEGALEIYSEAVSALTFAVLGAAIHGSVLRSRQLAAHARAGLRLGAFDGHLLTPLAQWGQSLSLVFVGGISLSLVFQSSRSLRSIESAVVYGGLVAVALALFFTSMWTVHVALAQAQAEELSVLRRDLAAARAALARRRAGAGAAVQDLQDAYGPVVTLGAYEQQVLAAPTWPFDPAIVRRVLASMAAPLGVYLVKLAFGVVAGP